MQQATLPLPPKQADKIKPLSPIEQLYADKIEVKEKCRIQEQKINTNLVYIRHNAGIFLLSGISSMLFPAKDTNKKSSQNLSTGTHKNTGKSINNFSASEFLAITKGFLPGILPLAWDILQPIAITWGLSKSRSLIAKLFSRKK